MPWPTKRKAHIKGPTTNGSMNHKPIITYLSVCTIVHDLFANDTHNGLPRMTDMTPFFNLRHSDTFTPFP